MRTPSAVSSFLAAALLSTAVHAAPTAPGEPAAAARDVRLGTGLMATGASLAAGLAVAVTLSDALGTPDLPTDAPQDDTTLLQAGGFIIVAVASVATVVTLVGGALTLAELAEDAPAPADQTKPAAG